MSDKGDPLGKEPSSAGEEDPPRTPDYQSLGEEIRKLTHSDTSAWSIFVPKEFSDLQTEVEKLKSDNQRAENIRALMAAGAVAGVVASAITALFEFLVRVEKVQIAIIAFGVGVLLTAAFYVYNK